MKRKAFHEAGLKIVDPESGIEEKRTRQCHH